MFSLRMAKQSVPEAPDRLYGYGLTLVVLSERSKWDSSTGIIKVCTRMGMTELVSIAYAYVMGDSDRETDHVSHIVQCSLAPA